MADALTRVEKKASPRVTRVGMLHRVGKWDVCGYGEQDI